MTTTPPRRFVTIARKVVTALTGLALCLFLVSHLAGNLLLLQGEHTFNAYSHFLISLPFIIPVEIGLGLLFLLHAYEALSVTLENRRARPVGYQVKKWARTKSDKSRKTVSSTFMMWSGIGILIFTILHVWHFKFGPYYPVEAAATTAGIPAGSPAEMRDLFRLVVTEFKKPWIATLYFLAMLILGAHLYHAVWSAFQTLGVTNSLWKKVVIYLGNAFTIIVAGGFALLPLWVFFFFKV